MNPHDESQPRASSSRLLDTYTAAHGHPLNHDGLVSRQRTIQRWTWGTTAATVALMCALVVFLVITISSYTTPQPILDSRAPTAVNEPADIEPASDPADQEPHTVEDTTGNTPAPTSGPVVHVAGEVEQPGIYTLTDGARVADALNAAGGLTTDAHPDAHNLARLVQDGEQILVPHKDDDPPVNVPSPTPSTAPATGPININTATSEDLQTLPGIGPALAQRIIDDRTTHGPFPTVHSLDRVRGIGPTILENLTPHLTTGAS